MRTVTSAWLILAILERSSLSDRFDGSTLPCAIFLHSASVRPVLRQSTNVVNCVCSASRFAARMSPSTCLR